MVVWKCQTTLPSERSALHFWAEKFFLPVPTVAGPATKMYGLVKIRKDGRLRSFARSVRAYRRSCDQQERRIATMESEADGLTPIRPAE
jgi:hypothetical protein